MDSSQNSSGNGMIVPQTNDPSGAMETETKADDPKQNLNRVINSIHKTLGLAHQLYLTVSSFNVASQLTLLPRLYSSLCKTLACCPTPRSVFEVLDVFVV